MKVSQFYVGNSWNFLLNLLISQNILKKLKFFDMNVHKSTKVRPTSSHLKRGH